MDEIEIWQEKEKWRGLVENRVSLPPNTDDTRSKTPETGQKMTGIARIVSKKA